MWDRATSRIGNSICFKNVDPSSAVFMDWRRVLEVMVIMWGENIFSLEMMRMRYF